MSTEQKTKTDYLEEALEMALDAWAEGEREASKVIEDIAIRLTPKRFNILHQVVLEEMLKEPLHEQFRVWAEEEAE